MRVARDVPRQAARKSEIGSRRFAIIHKTELISKIPRPRRKVE